MKIKHMRLVLPSRMRSGVQVDARMIAAAAARALHGQGYVDGPVTVQVPGHGRPAAIIAQDVATATRQRAQSLTKKD